MLIEKENDTKIKTDDAQYTCEELTPFQKWLLKYRLGVRKNLSFFKKSTGSSFSNRSTPISPLLTILPLTLGFSQFLIHQIHSQKNHSFFAKTLPGFENFEPKINFETFEYIVKFNDSTLFSESAFLFGQPRFLGKVQKYISPNEFNGLSATSFLLSSQELDTRMSSKHLFRKLDNLPSYLNGLNTELNKKNTEPFSFMFADEILEKHQKLSRRVSDGFQAQSPVCDGKNFFVQKNHQKTKSLKSFQLVQTKGLSRQSISTLNQVPFVFDNHVKSESFPIRKPVFTTDFSKKRLSFYRHRNQLRTEFQNLLTNTLLEKTVSPSQAVSKNEASVPNSSTVPAQSTLSEQKRSRIFLKKSNTTLLEKVLNTKLQLQDRELLETLFEDLHTKHLSLETSGNRLMSGYTFPDMTKVDLFWFFTLNGTSRNSHISLSSPNRQFRGSLSGFGVGTRTALNTKLSWSLPTVMQNYPFSIKKIPTIGVYTKHVLFRNPEDNSVVFDGMAVVLDSKKALDWKTNQSSLRRWFENYLSPSNSLVQNFDNFLGNYYSPELLLDIKTPEVSDFPANSFYRFRVTRIPPSNNLVWVIEPESRISLFDPDQSSLVLPAVKNTQKTLEKGNLKGLVFTMSEKKEIEDFFPLIEFHQPRFKNKKETRDFSGYSSIFDFGSKGNPDYTFCLNAMDETLFRTKWTSGQYKKMSFLSGSKKQKFVENWEPLNSNSWLILTQLSFAVFVFNTLKSLADNYGRELLAYLLDLVAAVGVVDPSVKKEIEILTSDQNKGYRVIFQSQKTFNDVVGVRQLISELYEVLWFLRNRDSASKFLVSSTLPRGVLLTGPPGTGKTLLVQALAGEAQVPVIILSGSSLIDPDGFGAEKLEMVFQEARELAPCIVFIDEIDSLSPKRPGVIKNPMGADEILETLISVEKIQTKSTLEELGENPAASEENLIQSRTQNQQVKLLTQLLYELDGIKGRDGVFVIGATNRPEVLDAALRRPGRFDKIIPVFLPSHEKRIQLLKFYSKRYGKLQLNKQGEEINPIPWDYLGSRTVGFSAADLATIMNESAIKSGLLVRDIKDAFHSITTIEHGIDRLTTYDNEKYTILKPLPTKPDSKNADSKDGVLADSDFESQLKPQQVKDISTSSKMFLIRLAYYQAGKILVSYLLETHPKTVFSSLWPRRPSLRAAQITKNLQNLVLESARLGELNDRVIGCYGGKAAEFLFLAKFSVGRPSVFSTLGKDDLLFAQKLVYAMVEKWFLYSKRTHFQQMINLRLNVNTREFRENLEKMEFYNEIIERLEIPPMKEALKKGTYIRRTKPYEKEEEKNKDELAKDQLFYLIPWWQQEISSALGLTEKNFFNGTRLYLYNPERGERNVEWVPPDECYHTSTSLKNVKKAFKNLKTAQLIKLESQKLVGPNQEDVPKLEEVAKEKKTEQKGKSLPRQKSNPSISVYIPWNDVTNLSRDYIVHSLILQSFNKSLLYLNKHRALLDRIAITLLSKEVLRQPEIEELLKDFQKTTSPSCVSSKKIASIPPEKPTGVKIVENSWGSKSRKRMPRWIDFAEIEKQTT